MRTKHQCPNCHNIALPEKIALYPSIDIIIIIIMSHLSPRGSSIGAEGTAGVRGLWTYSSGTLSECNEDDMWESMSSFPEEDKDQEKPKTLVEDEPEPLNKGLLGSYSDDEIEEEVTLCVNLALERARQRRSGDKKKESRSMRRSLVQASMISLSQVDLYASLSSTPNSSPRTPTMKKPKMRPATAA
jgi:uncharacterized small protein (DUF1192 family)